MNSSMQKYVEVSVQKSLASGTTTADESGNLELTDSSADFVTDGIQANDVVHDTSDDRMYVVDTVVDLNTVSLSAIGAASGTGLESGKNYVIYSGEASQSTKQLIASDGVVIVENASADPINSEVNIQYSGSTGIVVKITHAAVAAGDEAMRDGFEDAVAESLQQPWPAVKYEWELPSSLILDIAKV
jgi:hypothetical protein